MLKPMNFFGKLTGIISIFRRVALAIFSHHALLYWVWNWLGRLGNWKRIAIGISGWCCAAVLIWHGTSVLLSISRVEREIMKREGPDKTEENGATQHSDTFTSALSKMAKADAASCRAAIVCVNEKQPRF